MLTELESVCWHSWTDYSGAATTRPQRQSWDDSCIKTFNSGNRTHNCHLAFIVQSVLLITLWPIQSAETEMVSSETGFRFGSVMRLNCESETICKLNE